MPELLVREAKKAGAEFMFNGDALYSMTPPETMFGFTYHAHMIPPFKPEHTLILGYGYGTIAELMRKVWGGQLKVTGVDVEAHDYPYVEHRLKVMDAKKFMKDCTEGTFALFKEKFDYSVIDLWDGLKVPEFVFDIEFAVRLSKMATKMLSINLMQADMKRINNSFGNYGGFWFERGTPIDGNVVMWWSCK